MKNTTQKLVILFLFLNNGISAQEITEVKTLLHQNEHHNCLLTHTPLSYDVAKQTMNNPYVEIYTARIGLCAKGKENQVYQGIRNATKKTKSDYSVASGDTQKNNVEGVRFAFFRRYRRPRAARLQKKLFLKNHL